MYTMFTWVCMCIKQVKIKSKDTYKLVYVYGCEYIHSRWSMYLCIKLSETKVENNLLLIKFRGTWNLPIMKSLTIKKASFSGHGLIRVLLHDLPKLKKI